MHHTAAVWTAVTVHLTLAVDRVLGERVRDERGDVPGWVMVTMMTAMLVAALSRLAGDEFSDLFQRAIGKVQL